jgi:hypothetical protein
MKRPILPWALFPFKVPFPSLPSLSGNRFPRKAIGLWSPPQAVVTRGQNIPLKVHLEQCGGKPLHRSLPASILTEVGVGACWLPKRSATAHGRSHASGHPLSQGRSPDSTAGSAVPASRGRSRRFPWPKPKEVDAFKVCPRVSVGDSCRWAARAHQPTRRWVEGRSLVPTVGVVRPSWGL